MSVYEIRTDLDEGIDLLTGREFRTVRFRYRQPPTRRWTRFYVVLEDDGPTADEVIELASDIVEHHADPRALEGPLTTRRSRSS